MVRECDKCGEFAYATRHKDSFLMFCRACGHWAEPAFDEEGWYDDEKLAEMCERWPLSGDRVDERFK